MTTSRGVSHISAATNEGAASTDEEDLAKLRQSLLLATPRVRPLFSPSLSITSDLSLESQDEELGDLPPSSFLAGSWTVHPNFNVPSNFSLSGVDLTASQLPDRMKDLMDDYAYWLSLVERLGFDQTIFQFEEIPSLEILSRYFDSSHLGLLRVFHIFDKDKDTLITRVEIAQGLKQQGFYTLAGSQSAELAFEEFCDLLLTTKKDSTFVSPPEFLLALRCLRLAAVAHGLVSSKAEEITLHFHEYKEDKIITHLPLESPISFLFKSPDDERGSESRVYWIHAHEASIRSILALGVKYGLDPRFTLDVLSLWKQQALVDRALSYVARTRGQGGASPLDQPFLDREWIFSIFPVIRLSESSASSLVPFTEWRLNRFRNKQRKADRPPPPEVFIQVDSCNVAMFVSGKALGGTVISFSTEWTVLSDVDTSNTENHVQSFPAEIHNDFQPFARIMTHLRTSYSHLRTGDCHTLFLKALCDITEDYVAVMQAYEAALTVLKGRLDSKRDALEQFEVQRIQACLRQVNVIVRMVRPVAAIIDILETREWSGDSKLYLSDLKANTIRFLDNACATRETAKLLADQFRNYNETKTSKVLFALTLVTTMFVPPMFLVSLEGMNFENGMFELNLKYGYVYFWVLLACVMTTIFSYYKWMKWI